MLIFIPSATVPENLHITAHLTERLCIPLGRVSPILTGTAAPKRPDLGGLLFALRGATCGPDDRVDELVGFFSLVIADSVDFKRPLLGVVVVIVPDIGLYFHRGEGAAKSLAGWAED